MSKFSGFVSSLAMAFALAACGQGEQQQQAAPPPPLVTAVTVQAAAVPNIIELPGRIEAMRTAEVRARTDGIVEARLYREGTDVAEGQPLFRIDQRDYRAQVTQAQATLARAQAARANAASIVRRYQPLVAERAVSAQEFDAAQSDLRQADASVADARAALSRAQLQLSYTIVRAPIAGRVGRAQVTEGALVSATQATPLTQVDQMSPIYAVFTQSNAALTNLIQQARSGGLALPDLSHITVRLTLEDGSEYGPTGQLDFAGQTVDPTTGSQQLRARFPNGNRMLLPGQFVRAHVNAGTIRNGIAVPQRSVQLSNQAASVMVVDGSGTVQTRPVTLGGQVGSNWVILSGLKPGEKVVTEGWQKVQPGQKVRIQPSSQQGAQQAQGQQGGQPPAAR
ncbi:efflux RND transporter periplasmic adaptor subunit [Sphingomonas sp. Leaf21]|uniref:efflux RND transporter periplasmic adaptor subunit n=1 Tax=Sphingomonas sp. Leaf21 TaxID=2876550 RepID=UPI001E36CC58|nr:efflux RND transporter periplasmic adaptor subunit [Sphingomonas sp. Leaf21]